MRGKTGELFRQVGAGIEPMVKGEARRPATCKAIIHCILLKTQRRFG